MSFLSKKKSNMSSFLGWENGIFKRRTVQINCHDFEKGGIILGDGVWRRKLLLDIAEQFVKDGQGVIYCDSDRRVIPLMQQKHPHLLIGDMSQPWKFPDLPSNELLNIISPMVSPSNNAHELLQCVIEALCELRDQGDMDITINLIAHYINPPELITLAKNEKLTMETRQKIYRYFKAIPGCDMERLLSSEDYAHDDFFKIYHALSPLKILTFEEEKLQGPCLPISPLFQNVKGKAILILLQSKFQEQKEECNKFISHILAWAPSQNASMPCIFADGGMVEDGLWDGGRPFIYGDDNRISMEKSNRGSLSIIESSHLFIEKEYVNLTYRKGEKSLGLFVDDTQGVLMGWKDGKEEKISRDGLRGGLAFIGGSSDEQAKAALWMVNQSVMSGKGCFLSIGRDVEAPIREMCRNSNREKDLLVITMEESPPGDKNRPLTLSPQRIRRVFAIDGKDMWAGRTALLLDIYIRAVCDLRDKGLLNLTWNNFTSELTIDGLIALAKNPDLNKHCQVSLWSYLKNIPAFNEEKALNGEKQSTTTNDQHEYLVMAIRRMMPALLSWTDYNEESLTEEKIILLVFPEESPERYRLIPHAVILDGIIEIMEKMKPHAQLVDEFPYMAILCDGDISNYYERRWQTKDLNFSWVILGKSTLDLNSLGGAGRPVSNNLCFLKPEKKSKERPSEKTILYLGNNPVYLNKTAWEEMSLT